MKNTKKQFTCHVPNLLTFCNALMGLAATVNLFTVFIDGFNDFIHMRYTALMIIFSVLFDGADGFTARKLNVVTLKGTELDSMADLITSVLTPALLIIVASSRISTEGLWFNLSLASAGLYFCCGMSRLATYNVKAIEGILNKKYFEGLPTPAAAITIATLVLILQKWRLFAYAPVILTIAGFILGLLMVSRVPYLHMGKWMSFSMRDQKRFLIPAAYLVIAYLKGIETATFYGMILFLLSGPLLGIILKAKPAKNSNSTD